MRPALQPIAVDGHAAPLWFQAVSRVTSLYRVFRRRAIDEWSVRVCGDRVEIREGTRNARTTHTVIPREECVRLDPQAEMNRLVKERIRCGYLTYGRGDFPNARLRLVAGKAPDRLPLEWAPRAPLHRDAFARTALRMVRKLCRAGVRADWEPNQETGVLEMSIPTPNRPWGSGGRWGVRLGSRGHLEDSFSPTPRTLSARYGTLPILALLHLQDAYPNAFAFTANPHWWDHDEEPAPRLARTDYWLGEEVGPYEDTVRAALALGIPPVPDRRLTPLPVLIDDSGPPPLMF